MRYKNLAVRILSGGVGLILFSVPFYALLTVWGSSLVGHYTYLRLYTEVILIICTVAAIYLVSLDKKIRQKLFSSKLMWLIILYCTLVLIVGLGAYYTKNVTAKAFGYGPTIDTRYLLFFVVCLVAGYMSNFIRKNWMTIVLWPAGIVTAFGLLQAFVLPRDFLKHFGYNSSTIMPYGTINSNQGYVRIQSTLRGVNPYGAYLVILISLLGSIILKIKQSWVYLTLFLASIITLIYTFSRSAWIGVFVALTLIIFVYAYKTKFFIPLCIAGLVIILGISGIALSAHSARLQNIIFHTQSNSSIKVSSDQGHLSGLKNGLKDIYHQPFGGGTGTAGPASTYNPKRTRIAENYYIQVGQETGVIGLILFVAINILVALYLWKDRSDALSLGLFASFIGLFVVNMFSHAWTDPTLSYIWWGLAGIALAGKHKLSFEETAKN